MYIKLSPNYYLSMRYRRSFKYNGARHIRYRGAFFLQESLVDLNAGVTEIADNYDKKSADEDDIYHSLDIYE